MWKIFLDCLPVKPFIIWPPEMSKNESTLKQPQQGAKTERRKLQLNAHLFAHNTVHFLNILVVLPHYNTHQGVKTKLFLKRPKQMKNNTVIHNKLKQSSCRPATKKKETNNIKRFQLN